MRIGPVETQTLGQIDSDGPVLARLARRWHRGTAHLNLTVGVRHRTRLFGPRGGGQNDIGVVRRFRQEDVLHHKVIELCQRRPCVIDIGIRHRWVFTQDIHALDVAVVDGVDDFDDGQALLVAEVLAAPDLGKGRTDAIVRHALVVRQEHRDEARVRRALHVVLTPERVKARARPTDMTAHQRQADQAAGIVGAVDVLADAHAPEDHAGLGTRKGARHVAQNVRLDAANGRHLLRREVGQMRLHRGPVFGHRVNILRVEQVFFDNHMHDRVQHRDVSARLELKHMAGMPFQPLPPRIHDDQFSAALGKLLEVGRGHRMVLGRVGPDDDGHIGILDLVERGGHGT